MKHPLRPLSGKMLRNCVLLSVIAVLLAATNASLSLARQVDDAAYQAAQPLDGSIVAVGITAEDLERFGMWPWDRSVLAQAVEQLNAQSEYRPAAIGVDVLFASESGDGGDAALIKACAQENVVTACSVTFDTEFTFRPDGTANVDSFGVSSVILPFPALGAATPCGHVNAMYDSDGVLRHHLWSVPDGDGGEILSMPWHLYQRYCEYWGRAASFDPPRSQQGFWYVDYTSQPGGYFEYSISDLYDGAFDPQTVAGAVVLIGPWDTGLSDDFVTAADHAQRMYGVEYLANVLQCMIAGRTVTEVSKTVQLAAVGVITLMLALVVFSRKLWVGTVVYCGSCAACAAICAAAWAQGYLLHLLWPIWGCTLAFLSSIIQHYGTAQKEKKFIRNTFAHYVDPDVLNELLKENSDALGIHGKNAEIAVLFVDVRGFTSLSEKLPPEQMVGMLNRYLTLTSECVFQNGGTLDKFVGDCTMAYWGAPLPCQDSVGQACHAAMDMVRQAGDLSQQLEREFGYSLQYGIGIHVGQAVVGNVGSLKRMDYTAIGDTVNTASRLESNAPAGTIYISAAVRERLGERAVAHRLERDLPLKGKALPVVVYELTGLDGAPAAQSTQEEKMKCRE